MRKFLLNRETRLNWRLLLGVMCVALVVFAATIQVEHFHQPSQLSHGDCALCLSAHLTVAPAIAHVLIAPVITQVEQVTSAHPTRRFRFVAFSLSNRPPPADSVQA